MAANRTRKPRRVAAPLVAIVMGSQSDWATMRHAAERLDDLKVPYEAKIVSAHRTPDRLAKFAKGARDAGFKVVIAGAGGAAHLPGMVAAMTTLPVLGVPVESGALEGRRQPLFDRADAGRACRSARSPSARPARRMPASSPLRSWRLPTRRSPSGSADWRRAQTEAVAERPADGDAGK